MAISAILVLVPKYQARKIMKTITLAVTALLFNALVQGQTAISGVWLLSGPGTESEIRLTAAGEQIRSDYDLLEDDPSLYCTPASVSRIWANPNSRIKIEERQDSIAISYELFDLRRDIPISDESALTNQPSTSNLAGTYFPEMGSSFARYEAGKLIVESRNHAPGYIRTSRGIPQGANTVAIEELIVEDDILHITHTYRDNELYELPLVLEYFFRRIDAEDVDLYECTDANYDWFLELNDNNSGAADEEPAN
tara:strand:+ start:4523 stop:5281 length:759 start_codon:yes stop_codon:yes gene_type:complete